MNAPVWVSVCAATTHVQGEDQTGRWVSGNTVALAVDTAGRMFAIVEGWLPLAFVRVPDPPPVFAAPPKPAPSVQPSDASGESAESKGVGS